MGKSFHSKKCIKCGGNGKYIDPVLLRTIQCGECFFGYHIDKDETAQYEYEVDRQWLEENADLIRIMNDETK